MIVDHRNHIAKAFKLPKSKALRVCYWLERLSEKLLVHDNVSLVPFSTVEIRCLVVTVDFKTKECGCALCGEFAAESGQRLDEDFKLVGLFNEFLPKEIQELNLKPAVLYCNACLTEHDVYFREQYNIVPTEAPANP